MKGDMTEGSPSKILITFSVPMVLGSLFQQLYNTTDAIIVGKFVGKNALAAVGVANPIMSIAIFFIFGICIGISVLMSQFFGAGEYEMLKAEVSTTLIAGTLFSVVLSIICILISRWILIITSTPPDILNDADRFLKIIFSGLIFSYLYNFYSSSLRAIGDSKTPVIFLIISSVLNVILGLILIIVFKLGVEGSAIATVIAQGVSSLLCIVYVHIKTPLLKLKPRDFVINGDLLKKTIAYSWVSATQQTCLYIGRLLVQGVVNPFGTNAIAAYNSVTRVDSFVLAPGDSISASMATYSAQNMGAGKQKRIIEGYKNGNIIITIYSAATAILVFVFAKQIMKFFISGSETEVISIGVKYLTTMSLFYVLSGFCNIFQGLFRGIGKLGITLFATIAQIIIRVVLSYALAPYLGVSSVCYAVFAGWTFMIIYEGLAYHKYSKQVHSIEVTC